MSFRVKLPPFENVAANSTAVLPRLPKGNMYDAICFTLGGGNTQANMSNIRLLINGKIVWNVTGAHLDVMNNYFRTNDTATGLTMWFGDPWANDQTQKQIGSIDTSAGIEEMSLEVDLGAGVAPTLRADAILSPPSAKGDRFARAFKSMLKTTHAPAAAGQFNLAVALGSRGGAFLGPVFFHHANVTSMQVKRDGVNLYDDLLIAIHTYMANQFKRTGSATLCVFDPVAEGNMEDLVPTLRGDGNAANFEFLPTVSAADTVTAYSALYTTIDRV